MMNIIMFIDKVFNRIGLMYRRALIKKKALKCGGGGKSLWKDISY